MGWFAAGITAIGLTACGSSSVESALSPSRIIAFGDGQSDIGQSGTRYTVNGVEAVSNWTEQLAARYSHGLLPAAQGGLSYAHGNTRVSAKPDAAGDASTPTLAEQVDAFLASNQFGATDLVLVSAGTSDVLVQARAALAGEISRAEAGQAARAAAAALTDQVQRLREHGAQYIVVIGTYNLGYSIWGRDLEEQDFLRTISREFNFGFKNTMQERGYGNNVLYVDFEAYIDNLHNYPRYYAVDNIDQPVCTSVDAGPGIGIGTGQINSGLCTLDADTVVTGNGIDLYGFADAIYLTPTVHRQFGNSAYETVRDRW